MKLVTNWFNSSFTNVRTFFSDFKVKFWQASNRCKRLLEAAKLAYATKTRVYHFPETWLWRLLVNWQYSVLNKGKSAIAFQFNGPRVFSFASDKAKIFAKNFAKNSYLDDSGNSLAISLLELIWNCIIFL